MEAVIQYIGDKIVWIVSVGVAMGTLYKTVVRPLKTIMSNTDAMMGDRLAQAHDYWRRKGYCPPDDKRRLIDIHQRYAKRGLNHLVASYEQDLLDLPDEPQRRSA